MPNSSVSHQTAGASPTSRFWNPAWITCLVLGILYSLAGLVGAGSTIFVVMVAHSRATPPARTTMWSDLAVIAGGVLWAWAVGAVYIFTSLYVKRGSRRAARVAELTANANQILFCLLLFLSLVISRDTWKPSERPNIVADILILGVIIAANSILAWLLGGYQRSFSKEATTQP